jgi:VWFA-related protein
MNRALLRAFALLLLVSLRLAATAPPAEVSVIGESIDVRVVNVEAVVTDRAGNRVHGLAPRDLRLLVDGREVPIEFFNEVADGRTGSQGEGDVAPRNYLVYLDDSFSVGTRRNAVLDKLEADLALLRTGDRMAILAFDGHRVDVLSGWTANLEQLRAALLRARERRAYGNQALVSLRALGRDEAWAREIFGGRAAADPVSGKDGDAVDQLQAVLEQLSHRIPLEARTQLGRTAPAIIATLNGFEAPEGRKVLLYLTGAWTLGVDFAVYMPMIAAANASGYTVYPIDTANSDAAEITGLDDFAKTTGGRALTSPTNEVFRLAVQDSGSYYWLGFSPTWKGDDRGHRVVVEALKPGLQVRAKLGFADPSRHSQIAAKAESLLLFGGPKEARRLFVELGEPRLKGRKGRDVEVPVTLGVPVDALAFRPDEKGGYRAEVPLAIAAEDSTQKRADLPRAHLEVKIRELPRAGTMARFQTVLQLRNAQQHLVFTVQDSTSEKPLWGEADLRPLDAARLAAGRK